MIKSKSSDNKTKWTKMEGIIINGGQNRAVETLDKCGSYYISNFEDVSALPLGTKVSFLGGHPGDHRGVAKNVIKLSKNMKVSKPQKTTKK